MPIPMRLPFHRRLLPLLSLQHHLHLPIQSYLSAMKHPTSMLPHHSVLIHPTVVQHWRHRVSRTGPPRTRRGIKTKWWSIPWWRSQDFLEAIQWSRWLKEPGKGERTTWTSLSCSSCWCWWSWTCIMRPLTTPPTRAVRPVRGPSMLVSFAWWREWCLSRLPS